MAHSLSSEASIPGHVSVGIEDQGVGPCDDVSSLQPSIIGSHTADIQPNTKPLILFPTGNFPAEQFCNTILGNPGLQDSSITRIDWFEKRSWPFCYYYLTFEVTHHDQEYCLRLETFGKGSRFRAVAETLALNVFDRDLFTDGQIRITVWEQSPDVSGSELLAQNPPASLLMSMASVDDVLFHELSNRNDWCFTTVTPPDFSEVDSREYPKVMDLFIFYAA
ncbi:hypothetical protein RhiJN_14628 [Ceratobasidium sp. AG-Ba]|nr:hypothetical protein RhiJN_14628 [Ceratobasidium sp. AG-Ba]